VSAMCLSTFWRCAD